MKKFIKGLSISALSFSIFFGLTACDMSDLLPQPSGDVNLDDNQTSDLSDLKSVYQLAVKNGFNGTYEEWIESIKGEEVELRSSDGYIQWRYSSSTEWTNLISLAEITGSNGTNGTNGSDGKDGVDGKDGIDGTDGKDGIDGVDGKSAYQVYCSEHPGYTGTEAEWIEDLVNGAFVNSDYYTVSFDDGEGNILYSYEILNNKTVSKPDSPTKAGYIFAGWYVGDEKWSFNGNVITEDTTLTARWVKSSISPEIRFNNIYSTFNSVYFDLYVDNVSTIEAIALYKGGELVASSDDGTLRSFNNLLSNTYYRVEVTYSYDLNDGIGKREFTTNNYIWTSMASTPSISIVNFNAERGSVSFEISEQDNDGVGDIVSVSILDNENKEVEKLENCNSFETITFNSLLANTEYTVSVEYKYDLYDGNGEQTRTVTRLFTTGSYSKPVYTINDLFVTQNTMEGTLSLFDKDELDTLVSVELYDNDNKLVEAIKDLTKTDLLFENLEANSSYTVIVTHEYDLLDGKGKQIVSEEFSFTTHAVYNLTETVVLNTSTIISGDTINLRAKVDNPSKAKFTKAIVNGKEYSVDSTSTSTNIYISISNEEAGDVSFTIESLTAILDGSEYVIYTDSYNTATRTVYNRLTVEKLELLDENYEDTDFFYFNDTRVLKATLNNPFGYTVDATSFGYSFVQSEDLNTLYITVSNDDYYAGYKTYTLSNVTYHKDIGNETISKTAYMNVQSNSVLRISYNKDEAEAVVKISTVDDLLKLNDLRDFNGSWSLWTGTGYRYNRYNYYVLENDLDLSEIEWVPQDMYGIFNGNGHTISNLTISKTYENTTGYAGLFKNVDGFINDLSLSSIAIMVETTSTMTGSYSLYAGGFVTSGNHVQMNNCSIDDNSSIKVTNHTCESAYAGGLFAAVSWLEMENCYTSANVANKSSSYVGAFAYRIDDNRSVIRNSYNTGNIESKYSNNAILARGYYGSIYDSYNTGLYNNNSNVNLFYEYNSSKVMNAIDLSAKYPNETVEWKEKTYSFDTRGGNDIDSVTTIVLDLSSIEVPTKEGYIFQGWYENDKFDGNAVYTINTNTSMKNESKSTYFSKENTTLYARWYKVEDYYNLMTVESNSYNSSYWKVTEGENSVEYYLDNKTNVNGSRYISGPIYKITASEDMTITYKIRIESNNVSSPYCNYCYPYGHSTSGDPWYSTYSTWSSSTISCNLLAGEYTYFYPYFDYPMGSNMEQEYNVTITVYDIKILILEKAE